MKKIYVVFPVFNGLDSTAEFLQSMEAQAFDNYQIVICDDGSTDGTKDFILRNYPDVVVVDGAGDLWWTGGINECVKYVLDNCEENDFILTINNDVTIDSDYLQQKIERANECPGSIIGSLCVYMDNHDLIETSGFVVDYDKCTASSITKRGEIRGDLHKGVVDVNYLPGKGVLIPVSVFNKIGLYDDNRFPHYHADSDFVLMANEAGYRVLVDYESIVYSDVNLKNMTIASEIMTLSNILKTFQGRYTPNNYMVIKNFSKKHFSKKWKKYLIKKHTPS